MYKFKKSAWTGIFELQKRICFWKRGYMAALCHEAHPSVLLQYVSANNYGSNNSNNNSSMFSILYLLNVMRVIISKVTTLTTWCLKKVLLCFPCRTAGWNLTAIRKFWRPAISTKVFLAVFLIPSKYRYCSQIQNY